MFYPNHFPDSLKEIVDLAYNSKKISDVNKAVIEIDKINNAKDFKRIRIGILRTFTIETLIDYFKLDIGLIPAIPEFTIGDINNIEQEILDPDSPFSSKNLDLILVLWRIEDLIPNLIWELDKLNLDERKNAFNELHERLKKLILGYSDTIPLIISNFAVPESIKKSLHDKHKILGVTEIVTRINLFIYQQASRGKIRVFDYAEWHAINGSYAINEKMDFFAKQPIDQSYALSFVGVFSSILKTIYFPSSKVLAIDLDNTLWGGVLGEDGIEGVRIGHDFPGNIYFRIQSYVLSLINKGTLVVLTSKNNFSDVEEAFESLEMPLKLEDFVLVKANWDEKYKNMIDAAEELNLGIDSFVFLDDQKFEQEQIKRFLPQVKVITNNGDPLEIYKNLTGFNGFDSFSLEKEDKLRNKEYKYQISRNNLQKNMRKEDFLDSLELKARIELINNSNLSRVAQMIGKTNQFNLTTMRLSQTEIQEFAMNPQNICLTLYLSDKFGDSGLIGVCIATQSNKNFKELNIDLFLLSCRALGRGAEDVLWASLIENAQSKGYDSIKANFIPSKKNSQVSNFYDRMGMIVLSEKQGSKNYEIRLPCIVCPPSWISLV